MNQYCEICFRRFDFSFKENKIIGVGWVSLCTVSFIQPVQEKEKCNSVEQTNNQQSKQWDFCC